MNREQIYSALFNLVAASAPFVTTARRLRHWSDVGPSEQPALFQAQKSETAKRRRSLPPAWTLSLELYVYCQAPDAATSPAVVLNPLIDAIEAALQPKTAAEIAQNVQTLGGLVAHAGISGKIQTDEGVLGGQGIAIIPIDILVP